MYNHNKNSDKKYAFDQMQHFPDIHGNIVMFQTELIQQKCIVIHIFFKPYRDLLVY